MAKSDVGKKFDGYWVCADSDERGTVTLRNEFNGHELKVSAGLFRKVKRGDRTVSSVIKNKFCGKRTYGHFIANWAKRNWGNYE